MTRWTKYGMLITVFLCMLLVAFLIQPLVTTTTRAWIGIVIVLCIQFTIIRALPPDWRGIFGLGPWYPKQR